MARRALLLALILPAAFLPAPRPAVADGGAKETIEGAIELASKLKELLKKDADVGVWATAKTDDPDGDDFSKAEEDKDLDDWIGETELAAAAFSAADNNVDDPPTDNPYSPNVGHYARVQIKAQYKKPGGWQIVPYDPASPGDYGDVWTVAQDDNDEINRGQTKAAAVALFSKDGKDADACFKADVKNSNKNKGQAFQFESKSVRKTECSPLNPFRVTMGGFFAADEDQFQFMDLGGDMVRIVPLVEPSIDLFHTYWHRKEMHELFPVLRGYSGLTEELRRELYAERLEGTGLHLSEDPARRADFTVAGAGLQFGPLDVTRSGRTNAELLDVYFQSTAAVSVVAPEHAQQAYAPAVTNRIVIHSGDDLSSVVGYPFAIPANNRRNEPGADPMVGVFVIVQGSIDRAVELAGNTQGHILNRRLRKLWDGETRSIEFKLTGMAIHYDEWLTFGSTYG